MSETATEGAFEIHPSSVFKGPKEVKEAESWVRRELRAEQRHTLPKVFGLRYELKETIFQEPFELIKKDLSSLYLSTGREIVEEQFPSVTVYNTNNKFVEKICGSSDAGRAGFSHRVELYPTGYTLRDIKTLHHETDHHLGRHVAVNRGEAKKVFGARWMLNETVMTQLGFWNRLKEGDERGLVLEEGSVDYFAIDFVLSSSDPQLVEARKAYARLNGFDIENSDDFTIREICKKELGEDNPSRYAIAGLLIETLIEGARKIGEDEGIEMRRDILKTRIDTKNMRSLMDRVDRIFGSGTFSEAFHLKFNGDEVNEEKNRRFVDSLREKVGLPPTQNRTQPAIQGN